ncbi:MAG: FecR domain-containing protein, partial [Labilithrix sp.]|nr:FecR domain-containing protein [Labilithrix sp.]
MSAARCNGFSADVVGLLEGTADEALREHVATCDACRDAAHGIERIAARIAKAGDDFAVTPPLVERLAELARDADPGRDSAKVAASNAGASSDGDRISATRLRAEDAARGAPEGRAPRRSRRALWLLLAACASVGVSAVVGLKLADHQRSPGVVAARAWHGKVAKVARSGADAAAEPGLSVVTPAGRTPLVEGAEIKAGMRLATDGRTRARLSLDDGSALVLDRATEIAVEDAPRTIAVAEGAVLADVAHVDGAPWAMVKTPNGDVKVLGTKLAVTALADRTNVEVLRGEVEVIAGEGSQRVSAGQEGVVGKDGKIDVAPANDLAQRAAFGEQLLATHNEDAEAPASGLGELRAKRPGRADEKDRAVRLQRHAVKVRIAGNVARTEIDETFGNDTDDELEGIYRFPLPPGAQIERLALEVDGELLDGEFIDKAKASAIWRGAIQNAAPKAPKPREEIVWVPGPWHDPALLEWQRGGRFELRIFPIPKRGSRRVVIAYTETVAPVSGVRRYVYPLPQGSSSQIAIDQFSVDAQVLGHETGVPVRVRGYELEKKDEGGAVRLSGAMSAFTPSGDLAIEYGLDDKKTDATVWAYRAEGASGAAAETTKPSAKAKEPDLVGGDPFVAIALRPKLPRWSESKPRDQVIVVDAGRTMYGERFARARRLAVQMTQEMDRRDRVTVIACDVSCKALPGGFVAPGAPSAHDVDAFLDGVTPDGASDLVGAVRAASKVAGHDEGRDLRVALLSDGVATAGYRSAARVAAEVADAALEARSLVVAVPIGADADVNLLADVARGGGGVVVPYQPGQRLEATAIEVLNATYGTTLRDVEVILPEGLRDRAPASVAPLRAGAETIVTARMTSDAVKGDVVVRGKIGGDPFEAKYPIDVRATTDAGNAFVPRLFAAARIADREREPGDAARAELVALSRRFAVPSRATSLLVLESDAMFKAFGIERAAHGPQWTGEALALGALVASKASADPSAAGEVLSSALVGDEAESTSGFGAFAEAKKDKGGEGLGGVGTLGHGAGGAGRGPADLGAPSAAARPAPTVAPAPAIPPAKVAQRAERGFDDRVAEPWGERARARPPFGGRFMKKVYVRRAKLTADASPGVAADKLAAARAAVAAAPDERSKHKDLARMLALSGQLEELGETLEKWSARDPLDVDVIVGRADVAARRGDRDAALRILGGALAASALTPGDAFTVAQAVARSH